ncbi:aldo/keto reductase [Ensifer sp. ENS06]|uniref:aldo/keto reductase n=1 Tax=Ensifer sp. ENS06 TaxID=2769276 RepID=UPI00178765B6|nr:aldo/keto reductase [Ensifer sp. ENS06]MBD9623994.1 aldo/keto reductase [Ensifer sp. ENS06]
MNSCVLGLGLLSIGRTWGIDNVAPPDERDARELIETAFEHAIRFFDTAPAYARSEAILGQVLRSCPQIFASSSIATKMGEHWDDVAGTSWVSHSRDDLYRSLENSLRRLGRIDILQLHKANAQNVLSDDVLAVFEVARSNGVKHFGASVSDSETAKAALRSGHYDFLQFPFNAQNIALLDVLETLQNAAVKPIINRPLGMGSLARGSDGALIDAFRFVRGHMKSGIVLTGTSRKAHLLENIAAFERARL